MGKRRDRRTEKRRRRRRSKRERKQTMTQRTLVRGGGTWNTPINNPSAWSLGLGIHGKPHLPREFEVSPSYTKPD